MEMTGSTVLRNAWQGRWALVTGASAGIGEALAVELAAAGVNLVVTARRRERLEALALRLKAEHGIETRVLVADLEQAGAPQSIFDATEGQGTAIDVLVNNAGFGSYGEFYQCEANRQAAMVDVNCRAVVHLTRLFLPRMNQRKRGDVMIVASTASYQPVPYLATYAATKAFDRFLAEALAEEEKPYGVRVSALCPGPTESEFLDVAGAPKRGGRHYQPAAEVARRGLEGLVEGKSWVIPYTGGRLQTFAQRLAPRRFVTAMAGKMFRPEELKG
jgi:short-subunit dehydrogenase